MYPAAGSFAASSLYRVADIPNTLLLLFQFFTQSIYRILPFIENFLSDSEHTALT